MKCVFDGKFRTNCQKDSVPESLLYLVSMVLRGSNIKTNIDSACITQSALTIAQLLQFNCTFRRNNKQQIKQSYTLTTRQPPLPAYVGLLVYAKTRMKGLVEKLSDVGLSMPYKHVIAISTNLGNNVISRFSEDNVVCPARMRHDVFTTAAVDNIDHNPSSATATGSLHGTGISLFQHPSSQEEGESSDTMPDYTATNNSTKLLSLPESYANVPAAVMPRDDPSLPHIYKVIPNDISIISREIEAENRCTFFGFKQIVSLYSLKFS